MNGLIIDPNWDAKSEKAFHLRERKAKVLTLFSIYQVTKFRAKVNYLHFKNTNKSFYYTIHKTSV